METTYIVESDFAGGACLKHLHVEARCYAELILAGCLSGSAPATMAHSTKG